MMLELTVGSTPELDAMYKNSDPDAGPVWAGGGVGAVEPVEEDPPPPPQPMPITKQKLAAIDAT